MSYSRWSPSVPLLHGICVGYRGVLLSRFIEAVDPAAASDPYAYVAHILTNVTRLEGGREVVMEPGRGFLQAGPVSLTRSSCQSACLSVSLGAYLSYVWGALAASRAYLRHELASSLTASSLTITTKCRTPRN